MYRFYNVATLKNELKSYKVLKKELSCLIETYNNPLEEIKCRYTFLDEKLKQIKSPGRSDGLGGYIEESDVKFNDLIIKKNNVEKEMQEYIKKNKSEFINNCNVLQARISTIEYYIEQISNEKDKEFIKDFYINLSKKEVLDKYDIYNLNSLYRKADIILKKIIKKVNHV